MADILFPRIGGAIEPPGPQTRAFMAEARRICRLCDRPMGSFHECPPTPVQSTPDDMAIVDTIAEVLNHRRTTPGYGGWWHALTAEQIDEAARAVAQLLLLNFEITKKGE